jgi:hypothetical protein
MVLVAGAVDPTAPWMADGPGHAAAGHLSAFWCSRTGQQKPLLCFFPPPAMPVLASPFYCSARHALRAPTARE